MDWLCQQPAFIFARHPSIIISFDKHHAIFPARNQERFTHARRFASAAFICPFKYAREDRSSRRHACTFARHRRASIITQTPPFLSTNTMRFLRLVTEKGPRTRGDLLRLHSFARSNMRVRTGLVDDLKHGGFTTDSDYNRRFPSFERSSLCDFQRSLSLFTTTIKRCSLAPRQNEAFSRTTIRIAFASFGETDRGLSCRAA